MKKVVVSIGYCMQFAFDTRERAFAFLASLDGVEIVESKEVYDKYVLVPEDAEWSIRERDYITRTEYLEYVKEVSKAAA
jgi:hypothetical protein